MEVSIGIITYDDEDIFKLLLDFSKQKLNKNIITEVIIVTSNKFKKVISTTIKKFDSLNILAIYEKKRTGKYNAINKFLNKAKSDILVLSSGDIRLDTHTIEILCNSFFDPKIGVVASRPIPKNKKNNLLCYTLSLLWKLHHKISLKNPKFGELIAFRNLRFQIPKTSVDEEMIAMEIISKGYLKKYSQKSVIYNFGPKNYMDYIQQRRRIYCGHLNLKNNYNYKVSTLNNFKLFFILLSYIKLTELHKIIFSIILEGLSRSLGLFDFLVKKDYSKWRIIDK